MIIASSAIGSLAVIFADLCRSLFPLYMLLAGVCLRFHDHLNFVEAPRAEIVRIHADIHRERQRIVRQVAVRMSVDVPCAASMVRPYPHSIVAKHDVLFANMDLGKQTPRCEEVLKFPRRLVVVPLDEMDGLAGQPLSILRHVSGAAETEVSEE
jgi:hypothetical protein